MKRSKKSLIWILALCGAGLGCSITATRPVQEMSYTGAALKAAKEVQADTLAPDLFRQGSEWYQKAKREYKYKNFKLALEYAQKARGFAEQAEFEALRNDGTRTSLNVVDQGPPPPEPAPYAYPTPTGTPVEDYDKMKAQDDSKKGQPTPQVTIDPNPPPVTTGFPNGAGPLPKPTP